MVPSAQPLSTFPQLDHTQLVDASYIVNPAARHTCEFKWHWYRVATHYGLCISLTTKYYDKTIQFVVSYNTFIILSMRTFYI